MAEYEVSSPLFAYQALCDVAEGGDDKWSEDDVSAACKMLGCPIQAKGSLEKRATAALKALGGDADDELPDSVLDHIRAMLQRHAKSKSSVKEYELQVACWALDVANGTKAHMVASICDALKDYENDEEPKTKTKPVVKPDEVEDDGHDVDDDVDELTKAVDAKLKIRQKGEAASKGVVTFSGGLEFNIDDALPDLATCMQDQAKGG